MSELRVGCGVSVWLRGLCTGRMDGIGVYTAQLWRELLRAGVTPRGYAFGVQGCGAVPGTLEHLEVVRGQYQVQAALSLLSGLPFRGTARLRDSIDVFHATDHHIPKLRKVPVVATLMDAIPLVHPEWVSPRLRRLKNHAFKRAARWAQHVITISEFSKRDISDAFGIPPERISVTPLGFDENLLETIPLDVRRRMIERYGVSGEFLLFVGTLQPRKNVRRIIAAYQALPGMIRSQYKLVIVGTHGWGEPELLNDLSALERTGAGHWLRGVPQCDLIALMQSAKALLYPSLYEGFGLPVLEGFAAGIPVISSNSTSIPEVAGDAALLVDPLSIDQIADAIRMVVEEPHLADQLVEKGKQRLKEFSWHRCAEETIGIYRSFVP